MKFPIGTAALFLMVTFPGDLLGQSHDLARGTRIRVVANGTGSGTGRFIEIRLDTLEYARDGMSTTLEKVPLEQVTRFYISRGHHRADLVSGGLMGKVGIGAVAGAIGMAILSSSECLACPDSAIHGAIIGAVVGGTIAMLRGVTSPWRRSDERWESVPIEDLRLDRSPNIGGMDEAEISIFK